MRDRTRHGTTGSHKRVLLTDTQACEIRQRYAAGNVKQSELVAYYGVSAPTISAVVTGKSYVEAGGPVSPTKTREDIARQNRKLTNEQVKEIRNRASQPGVRAADLAAEYGVSSATIWMLRRDGS